MSFHHPNTNNTMQDPEHTERPYHYHVYYGEKWYVNLKPAPRWQRRSMQANQRREARRRRRESGARLVVKDDCQDVPSGCSVIEQSLCGSISAPVSRCHRCESALAAHFEIVNDDDVVHFHSRTAIWNAAVYSIRCGAKNIGD